MKTLALGIGLFGIVASLNMPAAAASPIKIVMAIHGSTANEFWQPVKKGFEDACAKIQADCQMVFTNTNMSVQEELANVDAALATNPDALILTLPDNNAFTKPVADARAKGIIVIAMNNDDLTPGHNARQSYIGPAFLSSGIALTKYLSTQFPKDGPINILVGVNVPGANWSEQRAAGVIKFLDDYKAANPGRTVTVTKLDVGADPATVSDRVGAFLNAHPDTTAYIETGSLDVSVAHMLKDRGVPPGKIILGGFDVEADVLQEMKSGYIQAHADQQPYMQGFMPVMEVYLAKTVGLAPPDIDTGNGIILPKDADSIAAAAAKGLR
jgi:simple sugar transport system substrate-binding protein